MSRSRRRVVEATVGAALLGGLPSTSYAVVRTGGALSGIEYGLDATTRIGVLVPPFRRGLLRGLVAHALISVLAGGAMARLLPRRRSRLWGAVGGLAMGWCNVRVIGRRIPAIAELPLGPQLVDNMAFGIAFAVIADRA